MIGTGIKRAPAKNTNPFPAKNAKGKSHKAVAASTGKDDTQGGGDHEMAAVAKRMTKGMPAGPGVERTTPQPYRGKNSRGHSFKTVVDEWCEGNRKDYRA